MPDQPKNPQDLNVNTPGDWDKIRQNWSKRFDTVQAHADRFFMTDDEMPLRAHLILVMIIGFCFAFILWSSFASLDEVTKGQGKVIPSSEIQVVSSLEGGIIDSFLTHEGDSVKAGQPLVRLRDIQAASDLGSNREKFLGLKAKVQRLQAEAEGRDTPTFTDDVMQGAPSSVKEELEAFRANRRNLELLERHANEPSRPPTKLDYAIVTLGVVVALAAIALPLIVLALVAGSLGTLIGALLGHSAS